MAKRTVPAFMKQSQKYVEYWVPRLRIEHWRIEVVQAPDGFEAYAQAICNVPNLAADILVRDPKTVIEEEFDGAAACNDLEVTIVHELIHVRFAEVILATKGEAHINNEQATEMTALALVAARRGVDPRKLAASK